MSAALDDLIRGAWDLHCHCYPETSLDQVARLDDVCLLQAIAEAGMAGVVLKSHLWPTATRAYYLQRANSEVRVLGSIALNGVVGGVSPLAVEAAARLGAKVVFFPTWQARHDVERGGFSTFMRRALPLYGSDPGPGLSVENDGRLTSAAQEVLAGAREFRMVACTGHLSPRESLLLCAAGREQGLPMVFSHPMAGSVGASLSEMRAAADRGAMVELCALHFTVSIQRSSQPADILEAVTAIGPQHCVLTSDAFYPWAPPAPELLRLAVGMLRDLGLPDVALRQMIVDNPRRLLEL